MNKTMSTVKKISAAAAAGAMMAYAAAGAAFAQISPGAAIGGTAGAGGSGDLLDFARNTLNLAIGLAALIAVGYLIYSGIQYIMANGDEGKIEKATKAITYAVIGLVICFISVLIVNFVLSYILKV